MQAGQNSAFGLPGEVEEGEVPSVAVKEWIYIVLFLLLGRAGEEAEGRKSSPGGHRQSCSRAQSSEEGPRSKGESGN